jgi:hypothetical protein
MREALSALGKAVATILTQPNRGDGAAFVKNWQRLLGQPVLDEAVQLATELAKGASRAAVRQALWPDGDGNAQRPDLAVARLHQQLTAYARQQAQAAQAREEAILQRLAYVGARGESRAIAHRRLGYAVAGFGTELLRSTGTELLSAGREAVTAARTPPG